METIVGKALEKEADRRYQSAAALAEDIDRYLVSKPIEARPPSTVYQLRKFARRNRVLVGGVVATIVVLVAGIILSEVRRHEAVTQRQASEANRLLMLGEKEVEVDPTLALAYTIASLEQKDSAEARRFALDALWRGPSYFAVPMEKFWRNTDAQFSPDGEWLAVGQGGGKGALWRPGGDPLRFLDPTEVHKPGFGEKIIFSPQSDALFFNHGGAPETVWEWSVGTGELIRSFVYDAQEDVGGWRHRPLHVSADGSRLISVASKRDNRPGQPARFRLLSWSEGAEKPEVLGAVDDDALGPQPVVDGTGTLVTYEVDGVVFLRSIESAPWGPARAIGGHEGEWNTPIVFDRNGRNLACVGKGTILIWTAQPPANDPLRTFDAGRRNLRDLEFDPSGSVVASGHDGGWLTLWSLDAPAAIPPQELLSGQQELITSVAFHPNGRWLAATPGLMFWPLGRTYPRVLLQEEIGTAFWYRGFAFSPDGTWVAASLMGLLRRIPLNRSAGADVVTLAEDMTAAITVVFDPAGRYLLAGGNGGAYFTPLQGGKPKKLEGFQGHVNSLAASPDGRLIAAGGGFADFIKADNFVRIWDIETWEHTDLQVGHPVTDIKFTGDDQVILAAGRNLHRWNLTEADSQLLAEGMVGSQHPGGRIDLSPDGRYVLGGGKIYDRETSTTRVLDSFGDGQHWVFDPTGTIVVSGGKDGILRVGRASGEASHWLVGHQGMINQVEVSPDGRWILSSGEDGTLRLWPMPDLDTPPLQALPHNELLDVLRAQTNLRVTPDPGSSTGYHVTGENPDFRSWDDLPPIWGPPERKP